MVFRAKVDRFFVIFIASMVLLLAVVTMWPLLLDEGRDLLGVLIMIAVFLLSTGMILWCLVGIKYVLNEDYLLVKGGPFRSRIAYEKITKITATKDIFTGYRLLSSRDGIEIFYQTAWLGSVKISPKDRELFLSKLRERCPNLQTQL